MEEIYKESIVKDDFENIEENELFEVTMVAQGNITSQECFYNVATKHVHIFVAMNGLPGVGLVPIATIPEKYRPNRLVQGICGVYIDSERATFTGVARLYASGEIMQGITPSGISQFVASIDYFIN